MKRILPLVLLAFVATAFAQQPVQENDGTTGPVKVQPANTTPGKPDKAFTGVLSPNNTGLPVNVPVQVQVTTNTSSGSVASLAKAYASNVTQGNTLIVSFCNGNGNAANSGVISDTLSLVWIRAVHQTNGSAFQCEQWFAHATTGGAETITVTPGGTNGSIAMVIYEYSGFLVLSASAPSYEQNAQPETTNALTGTGTLANPGDLSPLAPNRVIVAAVGVGTAAQTITPGPAYNNDSGQLNPTTPAGLFSMVGMSQYLENINSVSVSAQIASSEPWDIVYAVYQPVLVGVQGTVRTFLRANNGLPTGASNTDLITPTTDTGGRQIVRSAGPRELLTVNNVTMTATGSNTLIAAGSLGVFRDLTFLQCTNTSATGVRVDISDGTRTYSWFLAASGGGFNINFNPPLKESGSTTAWTVAISSAVTDVRCGAQSVDTN